MWWLVSDPGYPLHYELLINDMDGWKTPKKQGTCPQWNGAVLDVTLC